MRQWRMGYRCLFEYDLPSHCTVVTGMNIDTYGDQNNIKYPNKIKLIKLAVERIKQDNFLYILREKNVRECTFLSSKVCVIFTISE